MRFSFWPNARRPVDDILAASVEAEHQGWYGVWLADHYMPDTGTTEAVGGDMHEVWGLLPAVAALTSRVRIGTLVSPTSIHHPALLANRAATVDHLSHGRMVLGLGAGWQINEHAAYGFELAPPVDRVRRFAEAVKVVRSLLDTGRTTFHGTFYDLVDAPCEPKPVQPRLPILVGTRGPRMQRITARHGDQWNTWADSAGAAALLHGFEQACDQVGRDRSTIRTSANALVALDGSAPGRAVLAGSAAQIVDQLGAFVDAGYDEFIIPDGNLSEDAAERADQVARIKTEIVDQFAPPTPLASSRAGRSSNDCSCSGRPPSGR